MCLQIECLITDSGIELSVKVHPREVIRGIGEIEALGCKLETVESRLTRKYRMR